MPRRTMKAGRKHRRKDAVVQNVVVALVPKEVVIQNRVAVSAAASVAVARNVVARNVAVKLFIHYNKIFLIVYYNAKNNESWKKKKI